MSDHLFIPERSPYHHPGRTPLRRRVAGPGAPTQRKAYRIEVPSAWYTWIEDYTSVPCVPYHMESLNSAMVHNDHNAIPIL